MTHEEFLQTQHNLIQTVTQRFAWPGGYPMFAVTKDGGDLCPDCVEKEQALIMSSEDDPQWQLTGVEINWGDSILTCDYCGELIPSAYGGGPETEDEEQEPEKPEEQNNPWPTPNQEQQP